MDTVLDLSGGIFLRKLRDAWTTYGVSLSPGPELVLSEAKKNLGSLSENQISFLLSFLEHDKISVSEENRYFLVRDLRNYFWSMESSFYPRLRLRGRYALHLVGENEQRLFTLSGDIFSEYGGSGFFLNHIQGTFGKGKILRDFSSKQGCSAAHFLLEKLIVDLSLSGFQFLTLESVFNNPSARYTHHRLKGAYFDLFGEEISFSEATRFSLRQEGAVREKAKEKGIKTRLMPHQGFQRYDKLAQSFSFGGKSFSKDLLGNYYFSCG
ncbi:hypothetical protein H6501_01160 [Candidatus Woesearchaeota archaeon]|nr:hypothetical protein [Nanoarchaeota archaeon]MCB9370185.1 hypothetical protein [Candidatus Woesearchaeota archaeon]USN44714.1 MAG: hypothetical protein H6500_02630 [Candidatus Woesearchaeota archaeon]